MGLSKPLFSLFIFLFWMGSISKAQIDVGNLGKQVENGVENQAAEETQEQISCSINAEREERRIRLPHLRLTHMDEIREEPAG